MSGPRSTLQERRAGPLALLAAVLLLGIALLLPGHPKALVTATFLRLPLELPALVLLLCAVRGPASRALRAATVALLCALVLLRLFDLGSFVAFDRRFSPLVELHLLRDGWNLASGAIGRGQAGLGVAGILLLVALLCVGLWRATGVPGRLAGSLRRAAIGVSATVLVTGIALLAAGGERARHLPLSAGIGPEIVERAGHTARSIADQREFVADLAVDPVGAGDAAPTFAALAGRDVGIVFVEAYGRSALELDRFSARARARLRGVQARLDGAGLHAASGWLTSPVRGGRSWLAQATFASGLVVDDQARFDRLLGSDRRALDRLFAGAGWRTSASMPAIVDAWPDAGWYGFDAILDGHSSGYAGEPFGWVTMPDQYTLDAFEHRVRAASDVPVMGTIALISTHAPWTPVPRIVDWDDVGDGSIFDGSLRYGEPVTWTKPETVRAMYAETVDYTLEVLGQYLERYAGHGFFVVLGDHQPASIVDGWGRTADVPVHIVTDDPALLARLPRDAFTPGMLPDPAARSLPMQAMRELLATRYEAPSPPPSAPSAPSVESLGARLTPRRPRPRSGSPPHPPRARPPRRSPCPSRCARALRGRTRRA